MKREELVREYLSSKKTNLEKKIEKLFKKNSIDENAPEMENIKYFFERHLKELKFICENRIPNDKIRKYIDIKENYFDMMAEVVRKNFSANDYKEIVGDYRKLSDTEERILLLNNSNFFGKKRIIKDVCKEILESENRIVKVIELN